MKSILRSRPSFLLSRSFGLAILASVGCSSAPTRDSAPEGAQIEATGEGELTLTTVTLSPDASPIIEYRRITRAAADRMDARRRQVGALVGTAKGATGEESVGTTQQALTDILDASTVYCPGSATWLYDGANATGNRLCINGRGKLDLANICRTWGTMINPFTHERSTICWSYWWNSAGVVKSAWPGEEDGSVLADAGGQPVGLCEDQSLSWDAWGAIQNTSGASTTRWVEQHIWGKGCWLHDSAYAANGDDPQDEEFSWTKKAFQGVATTPTEWYVLGAGSGDDFDLYDTSKSKKLGKTDSQATYAAGGWGHAGGDLDWYQGPNVPHGFLFAPMEAPPPWTAMNPWSDNTVAVAVIDPITRDWSINKLDTEGHGPWVAINPRDQMLYTSLSGDPGSDRVFQVRRFNISVPTDPHSATVTPWDHLTLRDESGVPLNGSTGLQRVTGGAFSKNGHLYLVSWDKYDSSKTGIYGFDVATGRRRVFMHIDTDRYGCQELEGLTIDSNTAYADGDIHVGMWGIAAVDYDGVIDTQFHACGVQYQNLWFKHFRISDRSKL